jgi:hypothetical protein
MTRMEQQKARPQMFVIQIWPAAVSRSASLRGSVEHVAHRRAVSFSSYEQLVDFIQSQLVKYTEGESLP